MNTQELKKALSDLIASKSSATPQDVALALAINPKVIRDVATLERLKTVTRMDTGSMAPIGKAGAS